MRKIQLLYIFFLLATLSGLAQTRNTSKAIVSEEIIFPYQKEHVHGSSILIDGLLNMSYSYSPGEGKKTIKHVVIDPEKIAR